MSICLNKNTPEYQRGLRLSGVPEFKYNSFASDFVSKYKRFPEVDEIPEANSKPYLEEAIHSRDNFASVDNILKYTGSNSIEDANIAINNIHKDLKVELTPLDESSVVSVKQRPSMWSYKEGDIVYKDSEITSGKNSSILNKITTDLSKNYGIDFKLTNNDELSSGIFKDLVDAKSAKAFIYNGDIYINADTARIDAPLHEMMHLLVGSIKFSDPNLYNSITSMAEDFPNYAQSSRLYPNRTHSDINEELFISEFSKYVTNQGSVLSALDAPTMQKIFYNMYRVLDSTIFGSTSVRNVDSKIIFNSSVADLCKMLNSDLINNKFSGTLNLEDASLHRVLANTKSDLMKSKELTEVCE